MSETSDVRDAYRIVRSPAGDRPGRSTPAAVREQLRGRDPSASSDGRLRRMAEATLYDRLGGVYAIAAVVDRFSDAIIKNAMVGELSENAQLREWSTAQIGRLPGLKFMRTLWLCNVAGGPFQYS